MELTPPLDADSPGHVVPAVLGATSRARVITTNLVLYWFLYFTGNAQNSPSQASTVREV